MLGLIDFIPARMDDFMLIANRGIFSCIIPFSFGVDWSLFMFFRGDNIINLLQFLKFIIVSMLYNGKVRLIDHFLLA